MKTYFIKNKDPNFSFRTKTGQSVDFHQILKEDFESSTDDVNSVSSENSTEFCEDIHHSETELESDEMNTPVSSEKVKTVESSVETKSIIKDQIKLDKESDSNGNAETTKLLNNVVKQLVSDKIKDMDTENKQNNENDQIKIHEKKPLINKNDFVIINQNKLETSSDEHESLETSSTPTNNEKSFIVENSEFYEITENLNNHQS